MKTKTWILILAVVLVVSLAASCLLLLPGKSATYAQITSEGAVLRTVDLRMNQEFSVDSSRGHNVVTVRDGKIAVTEANCPDHYCMHRGFCNSGAAIVCLPNKLVISFLGEPEIDISLG